MDIPICPVIKNKQLVDSQIGVNSILSRRGRYVFPNQTVSCFLQWRHTSYKCWVSGCAHTFTVQKVEGGSGKMVEDNHANQTQIY